MDKEQIQKHVDRVREVIENYPSIDFILLDGTPESEAYDAVEENKLVWHTKSLEIIEHQQREIESIQVGKSVLSAQLIDEVDRHAKVTAKYLRLSAESAEKDREIERMREALESIANYCHLGESFHTSMTKCIKKAAAALSLNKEVSTDVQDDR